MAITISITATTAYNVTLFISGMDNIYRDKRVRVYLNEIYKQTSDPFILDTGSIEHLYTTNNILEPSTSYNIYVQIEQYIPGLDWALEGQSNEIFFQSESNSEGNIPTYTARVRNINQIYFSVSNRGDYYLRYFVRLTDSPQTTIYDTWEKYGDLVFNTTLTVPNLSYNTSYTVNVGYSTTSQDGSVTWIGPTGLQTDNLSPDGDGYVHIYTNQSWQKAIPYIYTYGKDGNLGWQKCGG